MAKETMAGKKKMQRAGKAKGLYDKVGSYGNKKSLNLRNKQLGKKGVAASKKRTVSISNTSYDKKTEIVTGPKDKPLTGKVDMGGGNMAVYRNGKRVTAKRPNNNNTNLNNNNTNLNNNNTTPPIEEDAKTGLTAAQKTKMRKGAKASQAISKGGMSNSQAAAAALRRGTKPAGAKVSGGSPVSRTPKAGSTFPSDTVGNSWNRPERNKRFKSESPKENHKKGTARIKAFPGQGTKTNGKGLRWQRWNGKGWVTGGQATSADIVKLRKNQKEGK